jgi:uncharacterized protein (TIGR02145 family)
MISLGRKEQVMNEGDGTGTFTDERDGQTYRTVKMPDGKVWMAQNLNYKPESGNSWCYDNDESMGEKYGRLYDLNTAMVISPVGWHLPTCQEWNDLISAAGGDAAGKMLKSKSGWIENGNGTDDYGFSALPGGYRCSDGTFYGADYYGYLWTATECNNVYAYYRRVGYDGDNVYEYNNYKSNGYSVRFVKVGSE